MINFLSQIEILLLNMLKLFKIQRFSLFLKLKRYCKAILNVFLNKKKIWGQNKNYLHDTFFESNRSCTF